MDAIQLLDEWKAKMKVLVESVEHHLEEEEGTMFPQVRKEAEAAQLEDLGARMEMGKAELGGPTPADAQGMTEAELMERAKEQDIRPWTAGTRRTKPMAG